MDSRPAQHSEIPAILGGQPLCAGGPPDWPLDDPAVATALQRALEDRSWGKYHGPHVAALADRLAERFDGSEVLLCSSGTVAVELALRGLNVGPGDEVIVAAYDFKGNFHNVLAVGAVPVLVDVDRANWNLDPQQVDEAVSPATRAVIVSHLHGGVVPMPDIAEVADRHGLAVIEDACQIPGGTVFGRPAGTWGDAGVFSFGGSKLLSAGRGGAIITGRPDVAQRIRLYANRGNDAYPISELQAAVVLPQLDRLDERNRQRAQSVDELRQLLSGRDGLSLFENRPSASEPGYYKVGFQYSAEPFAALDRDRFAQAVRAEGFALDGGFRSLHLTHSRRRFRSAGPLEQATAADANVLVLHHPVLLEGPQSMHQFAAAVDKIARHAIMIRDATE